MDESVIRQIQREGADALLDIGIRVPLWAVRLPFCKKPFEVRVTMKRPCLGGQIRIAREWLRMGVTSKEMWEWTHEQQMEFLVKHGKGVSRMIAYTICRGWWSRKVAGVVAWAVRNWMPGDMMMTAVMKFVGLIGTDPFIAIIRSAERTNPMKLRLSRGRKGS